jgi:hypothetical protein
VQGILLKHVSIQRLQRDENVRATNLCQTFYSPSITLRRRLKPIHSAVVIIHQLSWVERGNVAVSAAEVGAASVSDTASRRQSFRGARRVVLSRATAATRCAAVVRLRSPQSAVVGIRQFTNSAARDLTEFARATCARRREKWCRGRNRTADTTIFSQVGSVRETPGRTVFEGGPHRPGSEGGRAGGRSLEWAGARARSVVPSRDSASRTRRGRVSLEDE